MASVERPLSITGKEPGPRMRGPIPGPEAQKIVEGDARWLATTTKTGPITCREARGSVVLSVDGDILLDFSSGIGVLNTGHCHPRVVQAVQDQAARFLHFAGTDFYYQAQVDLAKALAELVPGVGKQQKVFFTNSGTESNEAALKVAAWSKNRRRFLAFTHAFHGRTSGSLSLTNSKPVHRLRFPHIEGVHHVPFPDPYRNVFGVDGREDPEQLTNLSMAVIEDALKTVAPGEEVAALFAEPIQGEGGYIVPPKPFFPALRKVLDAYGILLVADEVQTGFGRSGKWFAMEHFGTRADITTIAKAMGSGFPIGAAVFDARLDFGVPGAHSNTYGGNPVGCAAGLATLQVLREEKLVERAAKLGPSVGKRLRELQEEAPGIGDVRGLGLMWAVDWAQDDAKHTPDRARRDRVLHECYQRGLILLPCGESGLRLIPALNITDEQLTAGLDVLAQAARAAK